MKLPFSHEQFLAVFAAYNSAWWAAAAALWVLTLAGFVMLGAGRAGSRLLFLLLCAHWAWSGAVYHLGYFADINPAAWAFGALFLLEAALLAWFGVARRGPAFTWGRAPRQILSMVFAALGLAYPALVLASGLRWPAMPAFAVPCPTTLVTVSLLLALEPRRLLGLALLPMLWAVVGGSAALVLGVAPDLSLFAAGACLLLYVLAPGLLQGRGGPAREEG